MSTVTAAPRSPATRAALVDRRVSIRPIEPSDAQELARFYADLSPNARYRRFLAATRGITSGAAHRFATADHASREGLVAVVDEAGEDDGRIVGHACIEPDGRGGAEVAFAVSDDLRQRGVGTSLMRRAIRWAQEHGIGRLVAIAQATNEPMRRLALHAGPPASTTFPDPGTERIELNVAA